MDSAMAQRIDVDNLKEKLRTVTEAIGFELAELKAPVVGGRLVLRAYIHSPRGVTLDDCARVSRALSDLLDTEDLIHSRYTLEVSSLGLDRPLVTPKDFSRRIGERVKVIYKKDDKARTVEGVLKESDEAGLKIDLGDETIVVPADTNPRGEIIF